MELQDLSLSRHTWETGKPLRGAIKFGSPIGEVKLTLTEQDCKDILKIVSERLLEQTRQVANNMTTEIIEASGPALEDKS